MRASKPRQRWILVKKGGQSRYRDLASRLLDVMKSSPVFLLLGKHSRVHQLVRRWQDHLAVALVGFEGAAEVEHLDLMLGPMVLSVRPCRDPAKDQPVDHLLGCFLGCRCCLLDCGPFLTELGLEHRLGQRKLRVGQRRPGQNSFHRLVLRPDDKRSCASRMGQTEGGVWSWLTS